MLLPGRIEVTSQSDSQLAQFRVSTRQTVTLEHCIPAAAVPGPVDVDHLFKVCEYVQSCPIVILEQLLLLARRPLVKDTAPLVYAKRQP